MIVPVRLVITFCPSVPTVPGPKISPRRIKMPIRSRECRGGGIPSAPTRRKKEEEDESRQEEQGGAKFIVRQTTRTSRRRKYPGAEEFVTASSLSFLPLFSCVRDSRWFRANLSNPPGPLMHAFRYFFPVRLITRVRQKRTIFSVERGFVWFQVDRRLRHSPWTPTLR